MFTSMKLALLTALMSTGMEMAMSNGPCIFEYDRIMPRVTTDLTEEQRTEIRRHLKEMEGKPCHEIAFWANDIADLLPVAHTHDRNVKLNAEKKRKQEKQR